MIEGSPNHDLRCHDRRFICKSLHPVAFLKTKLNNKFRSSVLTLTQQLIGSYRPTLTREGESTVDHQKKKHHNTTQNNSCHRHRQTNSGHHPIAQQPTTNNQQPKMKHTPQQTKTCHPHSTNQQTKTTSQKTSGT